MRRLILGKGVLFASVVLLVSSQPSRAQRVSVSSFGVMPNSPQDATPGVNRAITSVKSLSRPVLIFPKGRYEFWPENAPHRKYFISNHDPVESRAVAMPLEGVDHLIVDGQGSIFIFHGLILPISIVHGHDITLRNLSIDYATPHVLSFMWVMMRSTYRYQPAKTMLWRIITSVQSLKSGGSVWVQVRSSTARPKPSLGILMLISTLRTSVQSHCRPVWFVLVACQ